MISRRNFIELTTGAAASVAGLSVVSPSVFASPTTPLKKLVTVIVPYPAGGSSDTVARVLAAHLRGSFADSLIVENKAGAAGRIAAEYARQRPSDGSWILFSPDAVMTLRPHLFKSLTYDWQKDFTPVSRVCGFPLVLFAGPGLPDSVQTVPQLVAWLKANPGTASYSTSAPGSTPHLAGVLFAKSFGQPMTAVNYLGSAPAIQDLLGKQTPLFVGPTGDAMQYVRAGKMRALATTGKARSPFLPTTPTLTELGYKNSVLEDFFSVYFPGKPSADLVNALHASVTEAVHKAEFAATLQTLALDPVGGSPSELVAALRADSKRWGTLVRESGFKLEF